MSLQGTLVNYRYDALDRLIGLDPAGEATSTRFYRNGRITTQIQGEQRHSVIQSDNHLLAHSTHTGGSVVNSLLGTDQQRSVLQSVTPDGRQDHVYTAHGYRAAEGGVQSLLGFNGEQPDPVTGCYLLGNGYRAYNPVLMRFHSPDSLSPFESGGVNPYAYCLGDPINMSDPTGHFSWKSVLSIGIAVLAIAVTAVTLGSGVPLTGPAIFAAVVDIGANVLSIASTLATELAPDSQAGGALGQLSLALGLLSFSTPYLAKYGASRAAKAAARTFIAGPVSVTRQGAVRVSNGQALKSLKGVAKLDKGVRNTVALKNRLDQVKEALDYVKYVGYAVKGYDVADRSVIPYFSPPQMNASDQSETTLDTFALSNNQQGLQASGNVKIADFLTRDQDRIEAIREV